MPRLGATLTIADAFWSGSGGLLVRLYALVRTGKFEPRCFYLSQIGVADQLGCDGGERLTASHPTPPIFEDGRRLWGNRAQAMTMARATA
jgi:hypothetical protein